MISDKNDNPPYFIKDRWEISVPERRPDSNSAILTVVATDKDRGRLSGVGMFPQCGSLVFIWTSVIMTGVAFHAVDITL